MTLTGENGILKQAGNAKEETRGASVEEARDLWKINQEADNYTENRTAQTLEELINDLLWQGLLTEEEKDEILGNSEKNIKSTGKVTIGSRTIIFRDNLKVGDYVSYLPQTTISSYTFLQPHSGRPFDQIIYQDELKWRVLNINEDGTIDLISSTPTSSCVEFRRANRV